MARYWGVRGVNFENVNNKPTENQWFNNIYIFIISPSNNWMDLDAITCLKMNNLGTAQLEIGHSDYNVKTIYYDM